jgi:hypothetical protein
MKYCVFCGRENADDAIRCWECGTGDFIFGGQPMWPDETSDRGRTDDDDKDEPPLRGE